MCRRHWRVNNGGKLGPVGPGCSFAEALNSFLLAPFTLHQLSLSLSRSPPTCEAPEGATYLVAEGIFQFVKPGAWASGVALSIGGNKKKVTVSKNGKSDQVFCWWEGKATPTTT